MIVFYTLDDKNGYKFGNKRQSTDCVVADKMLSISSGRIYIRTDSLPFFRNSDVDKCITFMSFDEIPDDAFVFLEEEIPEDVMSRVDCLYVFRWGRVYPSTKRLELHGLGTVVEEFCGHSHDNITLLKYGI